MTLPLQYPWNMIFIIWVVFVIGIVILHHKVRHKKPSLIVNVTGDNINKVKFLIDGKEPFNLRGVVIHKVGDFSYIITMTGDAKDG